MINDSSFSLEDPEEDVTTPAPAVHSRSRSLSPNQRRLAQPMDGAVTFGSEVEGAQGLDARRAIQGLAGNNSYPGTSMNIDPAAAATLGSLHRVQGPRSVDFDLQNTSASAASTVDNMSEAEMRAALKSMLAAAGNQQAPQQNPWQPRPPTHPANLPSPLQNPLHAQYPGQPVHVNVAEAALRAQAPAPAPAPAPSTTDSGLQAVLAMMIAQWQRQAKSDSKRNARSDEVSVMAEDV